MENKLMIFENEAFGKVRTLNLNGEPWFVAADVCKALELGNPSMTVERLDDDEKGISTIDTLGGKQRMAIINEPGLYSLVITSRKPEAKAFKRWITHEVIPAIRKRYLYRSPSGTLLPYAKPASDGLFFVKDYIAVNGHQGVYTLVTPKGKSLFLTMLGEIA